MILNSVLEISDYKYIKIRFPEIGGLKKVSNKMNLFTS